MSCCCLRPCQQSWCGWYTQLAGVTIVFRSLVIDLRYLVWVPPSLFAVLCLSWKFMRSAAPIWGPWIEFPAPKTTPNDTQGGNLVPPDRLAGVEETLDAPDVDLVGKLYRTCDFASQTNSWSKIYGVRTQWLTIRIEFDGSYSGEISMNNHGSHPKWNYRCNNRMKEKNLRWLWPKKLALAFQVMTGLKVAPPNNKTRTVQWPVGFAKDKTDCSLVWTLVQIKMGLACVQTF